MNKEEIVRIDKGYHSSGLLKFQVPYDSNGNIHGIETWYYDNGNICDETSFIHGFVQGITRVYLIDNTIYSVKTFLKSRLNGASVIFFY